MRCTIQRFSPRPEAPAAVRCVRRLPLNRLNSCLAFPRPLLHPSCSTPQHRPLVFVSLVPAIRRFWSNLRQVHGNVLQLSKSATLDRARTQDKLFSRKLRPPTASVTTVLFLVEFKVNRRGTYRWPHSLLFAGPAPFLPAVPSHTYLRTKPRQIVGKTNHPQTVQKNQGLQRKNQTPK